MKRIILFLFVLIVVNMMVLPTSSPQASKKSFWKTKTRKEAINARKLANPHEGLPYSTNRLAEISQATSEVTHSLPPLSTNKRVTTASRPTPGRLPDANLIDKEIFGTLLARGVTPATPATDEEFCRRVTLDITGRQPLPDRLLKYVGDTDPNKKAKLVDELLKSDFYVDRWTQWMGDLTRNFTIALDGSGRDRNAQYLYLKDAVANNKPFNQLATDLITFSGIYDQGPGGFLARPIFSTEIQQDGDDELAAEVSRTFLGTQAVCISCHNGQGHLEPINLYFASRRRSDYWGLSAFFAQTSFKFTGAVGELIQIGTDTNGNYNANTTTGMRPPRQGGVIDPVYPFTGAKPNNGEPLRPALARFITSDPQFSRAFTNRVFAHFFTVGLVDPVDGFDLARLDPNNPPPAPWDLQPSNPILLNNLGTFFQQNKYDLKSLIKLIVMSEAYGMSSRYDEAKWKPEYAKLYARKLVRRLDAEEVLDAVTASTLKPGAYAAAGFSTAFPSAMSLPGVEEPLLALERRTTVPQSDDGYNVYLFLQTFGRGDRNTVVRSNVSSISQALSLFNNDIVINRISNTDALPSQLSRALQGNKATPEDGVVFLYLITLGRLPSTAEIDALKPLIVKGPTTIADLQWALFNRLDFIYNY